MAVEVVIGIGDPNQRDGARDSIDELLDVVPGPVLVLLPLHDEGRLCGPGQEREVVQGHWYAESHEPRDPRVAKAHPEPDSRPEGEPPHQRRKAGVRLLDPVEPDPGVLLLSRSTPVGAGACAHAPEVEAKHVKADVRERLRGPVYGLRVHRAAMLRVSMAEHCGTTHRGIGGPQVRLQVTVAHWNQHDPSVPSQSQRVRWQ